MNDDRREILAAIARNKARHKTELPAHIVPRRALLPESGMIELFETMARKSAATVERIGSADALPSAVQRILRGMDLQSETVYLNDPELAQLRWNALRVQPVISTRSEDYDGGVGIAHAFCGFAETGSLALLSAPGVSPAAWFLPATLIVALASNRIFPGQEDCWQELQARGDLPRTITFMTGPSRTGDIEQKIVIGAHGPKRLHIVVYDNS